MRAVNLLPKEPSAARKRRGPNLDPALSALVGGLLVVGGGLFLGSISASGDIVAKRDAVADLQARLGRLPKPEPQPAADAALVSEQQARSDALTTALTSRVAWDAVLRRFSLVLPEDVWLTRLSATDSGTAGASRLLQVSGYTYSHSAVARLLARLSVVADLRDVQLQRSALVELAGRKVVQFEVAASVRGPEES
jgi:Tfp pilus assembly protein PilN